MGILDDIFAMDEEEDQRIAEEKEKAAFLKESMRVEENDQSWSEIKKKEEDVEKKASTKTPAQYDTKLKRVELGDLVWARTSWFKDQAFLPGRIADITEATCESHFDTFIPEDKAMIEFFSGTKENPKMPRFELIPIKDVKPYNAPMKARSKQLTLKYSISKGSGKTDQVGVMVAFKCICQSVNLCIYIYVCKYTLVYINIYAFLYDGDLNACIYMYIQEDDDEESSGKSWDVSHVDNMREFLKKKYNVSIAGNVHNVIMKKAKEFLRMALEKSKIEIPIGEEDESYDAYKNKAATEPEIDVFSLKSRMSVGRGVTQTITAGRWISFQHKVNFEKILSTYV